MLKKEDEGETLRRMMMDDVTPLRAERKWSCVMESSLFFFSLLRDVIYILLKWRISPTDGVNCSSSHSIRPAKLITMPPSLCLSPQPGPLPSYSTPAPDELHTHIFRWNTLSKLLGELHFLRGDDSRLPSELACFSLWEETDPADFLA